jgi:uncharacterized protein (TIGR00369 family)
MAKVVPTSPRNASLAPDGFDGVLGVRIISRSKDRVRGQMHAGAEHMTAGGRVHGGALIAFADTLGAIGAVENLPDGASTSTIESKTNFLRAAAAGLLSGESEPLHVGRSTMVWQTIIRNEAAERLAIVTQTQIVLQAPMPQSAAQLAGRSLEPEAMTKPENSLPGTGTKRRRVFEAAIRVIDQKGFNAAGMREIAAAADMPVSTLYQYVKSKDGLLTLIFDSYLDEMIENVKGAAATPHDSASSRLRSAIAINLQSFDRYRRQIRMMNRETTSLGPSARRRVFDHMRSYIGLFSDLVADGTRRREFRKTDPELIANLILMLCEVWPLRAWALKNFSLDQVRDGISDLVVAGLTSRKPSDGQADGP